MKTIYLLIFFAAILLFTVPAPAQAQNVSFNGDAIISGNWDSFTAVTAKSGCAVDTLTVDAANFTVSVPSGSSCAFETSVGTFTAAGGGSVSCGPPIRLTITGAATGIVVTPTNSTCVTPPSTGSSVSDTTPPGAATSISGVYSSVANSIALSWTNPVDNDYAKAEVWRNDGGTTPITGPRAIKTKPSASFTDSSGIETNKTYTYQIVTQDTTGNRTVSQEVAVSTAVAPVPPVAACGNSVCESGETYLSCPADCPTFPADALKLSMSVSAEVVPAGSTTLSFPDAASSAVLAVSFSVLLLGGFLIHSHTGASGGAVGFFSVFPLLFTSSQNSYVRLKKCGQKDCCGPHFARYKIMKHCARASLAATLAAGLVKILFMAALTMSSPSSSGIALAEEQTIKAGDSVKAVCVMENTGAIKAINPIITMPVPSGSDFTSATPDISPVNGILSAPFAELAAAGKHTLTGLFKIKATQGAVSFSCSGTASGLTAPVVSNTVTLAVAAPAPEVEKVKEVEKVEEVKEVEKVEEVKEVEKVEEVPSIPPAPPISPISPISPLPPPLTPPLAGGEIPTTGSSTYIPPTPLALPASAAPSLSNVSVAVDTTVLETTSSAVIPGYLNTTISINGVLPEPSAVAYLELVVESDPQIFRFTPQGQNWQFTTPSLSLAVGQHSAYVLAVDSQERRTPASNVVQFTISLPSCFDAVDNDQDGLIDYPQDTGCVSRADTDESEPIAETIAPILPAAIEEPVAKAVEKAVVAVKQTKTYRVLDKKVLNNPDVEKVNAQVAAPVIITATAVNTAAAVATTGVNVVSLLTYLQGFLTQPLLLFTRRRKKAWGVVYSSLSKLPVDLALVRLLDGQTRKLLQTRVTDKQGRYLLMASPGNYEIQVAKTGYVFPSAYLAGKTADVEYANLYLGGPLAVAAGAALTKAIPLDPVEKTETPQAVVNRRRRQALQKSVAYSGPVFAIVSTAISPTLTTAVLLVVQIGLLGLFKRLAQGTTPKSWGAVIDTASNNPLSYAVARIFDSQFNKLLETQVTDSAGRYGFLAGRGSFYITVEKPGYAPYRSEILDFTKLEGKTLIRKEVQLSPQQPPLTPP